MYDRLQLFTKNPRHPDKYPTPFGRLNTTRFSIVFSGPVLWNNLDLTIKHLPTITRFKKILHAKAIQKYELAL